MQRDPPKNIPQYTSPTRPLGRPINILPQPPQYQLPQHHLPNINPHINNLPYNNKWVPLILHLCPHSTSPLSPSGTVQKWVQIWSETHLPYYGQTKPVKIQVGLAGCQPRPILEGSGCVLILSGSERWLPASKGTEATAGFWKDFKKECQIHWTLGVHP